jgi:anthranilate synthase/aminodeoxychorismate synthase-like glutamine amidotransferase
VPAGPWRRGRRWRPGRYDQRTMGTQVLVIDNYDSFVYNLVQELGELGADPVVHRNDAIDIESIRRAAPDAILISPGPGRPESAGISMAVISELAGEFPILGVCLGHQAIGQVYGGDVVSAPTLMHGKTSSIHHDGKSVFAGLPDPFIATRYHSLVVEPTTVPDVLEGDRHHPRRGHHGPPPPVPQGRGGAVPSRVAAHPQRSVATVELPGVGQPTLSPPP